MSLSLPLTAMEEFLLLDDRPAYPWTVLSVCGFPGVWIGRPSNGPC